jgi:hypothetical protein
MQKTTTVKGQDISGAPRSYTFKLLDARDGLELFHREDFPSLMMTASELLRVTSEGEDNGVAAIAIARSFAGLLDWDRMKELCSMLLGGAVIDLTEDTNRPPLDHDGLCRYAEGDPLEQYLALSHALFANFPKYPPFFKAVLDSDPETEDVEEAKTEE